MEHCFYRVCSIFFAFVLAFHTTCGLLFSDSLALRDDPIEEWLSIYDGLLQQYVVEGQKHGIQTNLIDYKGLGHDPSFKVLLRKLGMLPSFEFFPLQTQLAMWLNAYNTLVLQIICSHPDRTAIHNMKGPKSIWKKKAGLVAGKRYSLDAIEHAILRKRFRDPRIHFALFCGTLSCPDLAPFAYRGENIETVLDARMHCFLGNSTKGICHLHGQTKVSYIFKWYQSDFGTDLRNWLVQRGLVSKEKIDNQIEFLDYDWTINDVQ